MIKAINYWAMKDAFGGTHPIDDALAQAKDAGFAGFEPAIGLEGVLTIRDDEAACAALRRQIDASGLVVETLASGMSWSVNPVSDDAATRTKSVELHTAALHRAAWLGCAAYLYVPGVVKSPIAPTEVVRYDRALDRARVGIGALLDVAEQVGVDLCIENVWNGMFYSPLELRDFVDSFGRERLGVYLDVGNLLGYQQHPPHWIELLGRRIKRVHVKGYQETFGFTGTYAFGSLCAGQVPWPETMAALRAINYDRTLVAEVMPWDPGLLARTSAEMDVILAS